MTRRLRFAARFPDELARAIRHYAAVSPELGERFKTAVRESLARIEKHPEAYAVCFDDYRAVRAKPFPYLLLYRADDSSVRVIAIVHGASGHRGFE